MVQQLQISSLYNTVFRGGVCGERWFQLPDVLSLQDRVPHRRLHLPLSYVYLSLTDMSLFQSAVTLQRMTSTYVRVLMLSHTLIYVRGTLGIRRVRPNTLTYLGVRCVIRRGQTSFGHVQNSSAYSSV